MFPDLYVISDKEHGLGHAMRCYAVGCEWKQRGGRVLGHPGLIPKEPCVVVFDGYYFTNEVRQNWLSRGHTVVVIDNIGGVFAADIVVNPNLGWEQVKYSFLTDCRFLSGPRYFPLRPEIMRAECYQGESGLNVDALDRQTGYDQFARMMGTAKYVITRAGVSCYEALYLNKPVLLTSYLKSYEMNEKGSYYSLIGNGYCVPWTMEAEREVQATGLLPGFVKRGRDLVDGFGAERIVDEIEDVWRDKCLV